MNLSSRFRLAASYAFVATLLVLLLPAGPAGALLVRHTTQGSALSYRVKLALTLPKFPESQPVALDASGHIAGTADLDGVEHCVFYAGAGPVDFTPSDARQCRVNAMDANGTVVGRIETSAGSEGFVYRDGRLYPISIASDFTAINARGLVAGRTQGGEAGLYDPARAIWTALPLDARGCRMATILALNDRGVVFGDDTCTGTVRYERVASGRVTFLTIPAGLSPAGILDDSNRLVLYDEQWGGHAYLWRADSDKAPSDLGAIRADTYGTYVPVASNGHSVVGQNFSGFFPWVWDPATGMQNLDDLFLSRKYFEIAPVAIDAAGEILGSAFDFDTGDKVWLVLEPVRHP